MAKSKGLSSQDAEASTASNGLDGADDGQGAEGASERANERAAEVTRLAVEAVGTMTLVLSATLHENDSIHSEMQVIGWPPHSWHIQHASSAQHAALRTTLRSRPSSTPAPASTPSSAPAPANPHPHPYPPPTTYRPPPSTAAVCRWHHRDLNRLDRRADQRRPLQPCE